MASQKEVKKIEGMFSRAFGMTCRVLQVKLNEGYDSDFNESYDLISGKPEDLLEEALRSEAVRDNSRKFENDVFIYLINRVRNYFSFSGESARLIGTDEMEIYHFVNSARSVREKAGVLQANGDYRFFGMASGFIPDNRKEKACCASCYRGASAFFEEREGRTSARAQVLDKLGCNFQRYFSITKEVFDEFLSRIDTEECREILGEDATDRLLDELQRENNAEERLRIINRLKKATEKNYLEVFLE